MLDGYWTNTFLDSSPQPKLDNSENIYIENGAYYFVETFADKKQMFKINNFHFDSKKRTVFFVKERVDQEELFRLPHRFRYNVNELNLISEDLLSGTENGVLKIQYQKKKVFPPLNESTNAE